MKDSGFIITMIKKIVLGLIAVVFISLLGLVLFFPLDSFVKKKIYDSIGSAVSFSGLRIGWSKIAADNVLIKTSEGTDFLRIKQLRLSPHLWGLFRKRLEIKEIELDSPELFMKKTKSGRWLFPEFKKKDKGKSSIELIVKEFKVDEGKIFLADEVAGFNMNLTGVVVKIKNRISFFHSGKTAIDAAAQLPSSGRISFVSEGNMNDKSLKGVFSINNMDMVILRPYMKGDVRVNKGRLNLNSTFNLDKGYLKAPSVLRVKDIDIETKGVFLGVSAPLVLELVKKRGEIDLDFNVWGRWNNLQNDLKESFKRKVFEEVGKTLVSPLEDVVREIEGILPFKR
ncbi:MAG: DUF748 domain-containing protein [Nitrospirae bacterium]|nr:DUF748 domain-containing protein [Nitrospirota bacterium]